MIKLFKPFCDKKIIGPFAFTAMLFILESLIKGLTMDCQTVFYELSPKLSLWATGVFFTLSVSEQTQFKGKLAYDVSSDENKNSVEIKYRVIPPSNLSFSPKYIYMLIVSLVSWLVCVILSYKSIQIYNSFIVQDQVPPTLFAYTIPSMLLAFFMVGFAISSLKEVYS